MRDEGRALLIVAALLVGASNTTGFVAGRMSVEVPPPEVRIVRMPPRLVRMLPPIVVPAEPVFPEAPPPPAAVESPHVEPPPPIAEPHVSAPPVVEATPLPQPRPKVEQPKPQPKARPKPQQPKPPRPDKDTPAKKPLVHKALPSCAVVKREYDAMTWPERMAAYRDATAAEIAHGKRCLGF